MDVCLSFLLKGRRRRKPPDLIFIAASSAFVAGGVVFFFLRGAVWSSSYSGKRGNIINVALHRKENKSDHGYKPEKPTGVGWRPSD